MFISLRVLKLWDPTVHLLDSMTMDIGNSTVNLRLRVWIDDPKNGIENVKNAVLLKIWDSFHANGIEIAFPQRDLHIESAVPLGIYRDRLPPSDNDSPTNEEQKDTPGWVI